jgi:tripartite-type tricarboxylate transporter receptor subunit TctC
LVAAPAHADAVADFYRGKTFTIVVGHETGTGFDIYSRTLARHIGRHIPGEPAVVVQNIVGASGLSAANWLYNVAPKDGTVMATFVHTAVFEPVMGNTAARFDPAKFSWIGNVDDGIGICGVSKASGINTFDDLRTKEVVFGGTGTTGPLSKYALAIKNLLGARIKLVAGYKGSASVKLAIDRGEVNGVCGVSLSTVQSQWKADYESGAFKIILQLSGKPRPSLAGVPHVESFAKSPEERQLFGLIFGVEALGRIYVAPPAIPPERKAALRAAFNATMQEPQFLAEAAKLKLDVEPETGQAVEEFIARISASSPDVVARAKAALHHD